MKLHLPVAPNSRGKNELGNQSAEQAEQDLLSPFSDSEMHSHPFAT